MITPSAILQLQLERCDRCHGPALHEASFGNGELRFCGHHFNKHLHGLMVQALRWNTLNPLQTIKELTI